MRDATRAAMLTFGRLLAEDVRAVRGLDERDSWQDLFIDLSVEMLRRLDRLDVDGGEHHDRALEELRAAPGREWVTIAEAGGLEEQVAHVLAHYDHGGYLGSNYVRQLLRTIEAADAVNRDALSVGMPEYVGLMRAVMSSGGTDSIARLQAVVA